MCANGFTIKYGAFTINCRPVDENKRVEPSRILEYREQHHFQTPFCLCPLLGTLNEGPTEAAILEKRSGTHVGEYVAECASDCCGYFGEFCHIPRAENVWREQNSFLRSGLWGIWNPSEKISFERWTVLWKIKSTPSWKLIFEATKNINLPSIITGPDVEQSRSQRPLKRTYAVAGQII